MEHGAFIDLGKERSTLRWRRHQDGLVHFEVVRADRSSGRTEMATFTCTVDQFMSVCDGGNFQIVGEHGSLMARCRDEQVWVIFSVNRWDYQDSCLIPLHRFTMILQGEEMPKSGQARML